MQDRDKQIIRKVLYVVLAILMITTFYLIFNVGNPNSLLRYIIEDTSFDLLITVLCSVGIGVIVIILSHKKEDRPLKYLLDMNKDHIRTLREKGKSDHYIAEDFLKAVGIKKGFFYRIAFWRVLRYLAKME